MAATGGAERAKTSTLRPPSTATTSAAPHWNACGATAGALPWPSRRRRTVGVVDVTWLCPGSEPSSCCASAPFA